MSDPIEEAKRSIDRALDLWEAPPVSADFDRRLYRRIEERQAPWWRAAFTWPQRFVPVAAAAAVLLGIGIWVHQPGATPAAPRSAAVEALPPDQAEKALREMEMIEEFNRLVRSDLPVDHRM